MIEEKINNINWGELAETEDRNNYLIYLACPYSDDDPDVMAVRFDEVTLVSAVLTDLGFSVFSPVSYGHVVARWMSKLSQRCDDGDQTSYARWRMMDERFLSVCDCLIVLGLGGWDRSIGVTAEIACAKNRGIKVLYLDAASR